MPNTDVQSSLEGITYPCEKRDIIQHARDKGASIDSVRKLENLPDRQYEDHDDVITELGSQGEDETVTEENEGNKM